MHPEHRVVLWRPPEEVAILQPVFSCLDGDETPSFFFAARLGLAKAREFVDLFIRANKRKKAQVDFPKSSQGGFVFLPVYTTFWKPHHNAIRACLQRESPVLVLPELMEHVPPVPMGDLVMTVGRSAANFYTRTEPFSRYFSAFLPLSIFVSAYLTLVPDHDLENTIRFIMETFPHAIVPYFLHEGTTLVGSAGFYHRPGLPLNERILSALLSSSDPDVREAAATQLVPKFHGGS